MASGEINIDVNVRSDDDKKLVSLASNLEKVGTTAKKAAQDLNNLPKGANQASAALINLGRVAQDAPFGFIGIANNINPLLESFQRLQAETGSTSLSLKALASSLAGGAGIGLAVSAVTTLLTLFGQGMFDSKEAAVDLSREIENLGISVGVAKEEFESFNKELDGLKALRNINLKLNIKDDKERVLTALGFDKATIENQLILLRPIIEDAQKEVLDIFNVAQEKGSRGLRDLISHFTDFNEIKKRSNDLSENDLKLINGVLAAEKELNKLFQQREELQGKIQLITAQAQLDVKEIEEKEHKVKKIKIKPEKIRVVMHEHLLEFEEAPKLSPESIKKLSGSVQSIMDAIKIDKDAAAKQAQEISIIVTSTIVEGALGIGDAIEQAVAGKGNVLGGFFSAIFKSLGSGLQRLGAMFLASNKVIQKIKLTFGTELSIAASLALIAIGSLIKASATKIPGFAGGVRNFRGGLAIVGERGPELVNLPNGSDVIPNHKLGNIGGMDLYLSGEFRVQGSDLVVVLNRAQATNRRNN